MQQQVKVLVSQDCKEMVPIIKEPQALADKKHIITWKAGVLQILSRFLAKLKYS
jgi:hypothetical protein